ncbi:RNA polymerase sigma-70 factor (ECF subfamily) [Nocardioides sp. BE266]|uniref:RNA polymerase sigma factor n=1 Tax=Nocardioides sp. BE266 TaxID=2817725 RepID=UPI0028600BF5|nr:sigma-70 family RNA polymerase sigma factor [Nocardioides sp. BE266]MDR7253591.1 RNA polymerase sigma-70 factor (ECF subfamily) [Nocardioides sp. BE266]
MRANEQREYDWYFRACFPPVSRTVFLMVHDRELAEDITQEALYRMLRHWRTVSEYERPEAWVRRVAIRIAVRELQRRAARVSKERLGQPTSYDELPDPDVARAVAELAPMQRAAVVLFYWEDRPVHEIAEVLAVSESTVKQHLYRARQRLASLLGEGANDHAR